MHDTARTGTRVDLQAPRPPAGTPRARLHALAARGIALYTGNTSAGARLIVRLCEGLSRALVDTIMAERRATAAERAARLADGRVEFMERATREQQRTIDELTAQLHDARESIRMLSAESFDVPTSVHPGAPPRGRR